MDPRAMGVALVLSAVLLLTGAQVILKKLLNAHGAIPLSFAGAPPYMWGLAQDWRLWLGGLGLASSALLWYAGISRLPLSQAYVLAALTYPLIFFSAVLVLREPFTWAGLVGNVLIVVGVVLAAGARAS